jgi:hypothetical protein
MSEPEGEKTHREVKEPKISARYLADFMGASERGARTIVRGCKYQAIARIVQHDEAKITVAKFIRDGGEDTAVLTEKAQNLRDKMADSPFDRDLLDHNADYIDRFAAVVGDLELPKAELLPAGKSASIKLGGVTVTNEIQFRLRRLTKTNKVRVGAAALRYMKGKALPEEVGLWQSAFMFGYLKQLGVEHGAEPEQQLCLTVDAYSGLCHSAPSDSVSRFHNMEAACTTIYEWWPNIQPPPNAKF